MRVHVYTADAILALFNADDVILRPSEIIRRTGRKPEAVRKALKLLVNAGRLFHISHSQYACRADARPIEQMRSGQMGEILRALARIEERLANLEGQVLP